MRHEGRETLTGLLNLILKLVSKRQAWRRQPHRNVMTQRNLPMSCSNKDRYDDVAYNE